jgi:uncharacterized protein with NRDE domain
MCTVTAVPRSRLSVPSWAADPLFLRLVCNRDESRTRADALPPVVQTIEGRRAVMPLDPDSGGSWIAVNENGLVFTLLNANPPRQSATAGLSRGGLIPRLAGADSLSEALARVLDTGVERYRPFRLLMLDRSQLVECWIEDGRPRHRRAYLQDAMMRTSSSLGDAVVEGPRRTLFRRLFNRTAHAAAAQDAFHDHQWQGREHVSVRMERADASTVSRTTIEVSASFATVIYGSTSGDVCARVVLPLAASMPLARTRCS